jgi:vitamin B12 transporter
VNNIWDTTLQVAQYKNDQNNKDSYVDSFFNTKRQSANWQNDISVGDAQLVTVGVDYYEDKGDVYVSSSFVPEENVSFDSTAFFAQDQFSIAKNDFILGLRHDDHSEYGEHDTGDLSWGRNLTNDLRMTASYGTGFRAPTLTDLYYPGYSNPDLDPEKSKSYEIGLKGNEQSFNWEANVYQIDVKNLIAYNPAIFAPDNVEKAQIQGLELAANTTIKEWRLGSNVTFSNPINETTGGNLILRSKRVLNINADRSFGKFDVGASFIAKSEALYFSNEIVPGYGTVDLRGTYHVTDEVDLQLKVNNILDKKYEVTRDPNFGYGNQYADGANAFLTVTYTPDIK